MAPPPIEVFTNHHHKTITLRMDDPDGKPLGFTMTPEQAIDLAKELAKGVGDATGRLWRVIDVRAR